MKISYQWLKEYIKLNKSPQEIADLLTLASFPVELIESTIDNKIIVAQIKEINPHPNADRLKIAMVNTGKEILQIVCGATNIKIGQKVPLAQIRARIGDIKIQKAQIRGIESSGMLCSDKELGLSNDHSGIKILPSSYEVGKKLNKYLKNDAILDVEITPNRGDCLSYIGIARELSAIMNVKYYEPQIKFNHEGLPQNDLEVIVEAKDLCQQYFALEIDNIKVGESPDWLKNKLLSARLRPINNIVDISNFVMLEFGQPLHIFDADKIKNKKIIIRAAGEMEKITTLDNKNYQIPAGSALITDKNGPIAIAGIMGGKNTEVNYLTKNIIIESAEFDSKSVRRTSKLIGLSTDASYRFERGIDADSVEPALKRAGDLVLELVKGQMKSLVQSANAAKRKKIKIEYKKINQLLGANLENKKIDKILSSLGFTIIGKYAIPPSWRHDIDIWQDLSEEVGRISGYDKINFSPVTKTKPGRESDYYYKEHIKNVLVDNGFTESYNYVFLSDIDIKIGKLKPSNLLEIANPLHIENKYLRPGLIAGLLKNVAKNPSFDQNFIFEIGNVFNKKEEANHLAIVTAGRNAKKEMEHIVKIFHKLCNLNINDCKIIELNREKLVQYKIKKPVVYAWEIEINKLIKNVKISKNDLKLRLIEDNISYIPVSQFPPSTRDLSFIVNNKIKFKDIKSTIIKSDKHIFLVELFDEYSSDRFGKNKKNIAFHIWMQDLSNAMKDEQIEKIIQKIINTTKDKFGASLRS